MRKFVLLCVVLALPLFGLGQSVKGFKGYELAQVVTACPAYRSVIVEATFKRAKINVKREGFRSFLGVYRIEGTHNLCFVFGRLKK